MQIIGGGAQIAPASGSPTVRNVISGNGGSGVHVIDANVTLLNSYIGTDVSGNAPIGNDGHGVFFEGASGSIGSTVRTGTGAGNLISGNRGDGIHVVGGATEGSQPTLSIQSNKIGTNAAGDPSDATMGNAGDGVSLFNVGGGQIGGEEDISPNTIAFNAGNLSQWQERCATNSRTFS